MTWQPIETAPKDGTTVLGYNEQGHEIMEWVEAATDCPDQPGNDEGWLGIYAWPGRSWGSDKFTHEGQGQPTHWMPLPAAPEAV